MADGVSGNLTLDTFLAISHHGQYHTEYRFHKTRRWRFDYAWPDRMVAVEYEGHGKGHLSRLSYTKDCEKYSEAALLGWCVIRVTALMVKDGRAFDLIERALYAD